MPDSPPEEFDGAVAQLASGGEFICNYDAVFPAVGNATQGGDLEG
jgi:hypothetical protein